MSFADAELPQVLARTRRERPIPVYFVGVGEGIDDRDSLVRVAAPVERKVRKDCKAMATAKDVEALKKVWGVMKKLPKMTWVGN